MNGNLKEELCRTDERNETEINRRILPNGPMD